MEFSFSHLVRNCSDAIKFQEVFVQFCCRSPHGERGLKLELSQERIVGLRRSPHGERGLKYAAGGPASRIGVCRSPHGERGLKFRCRRRRCGRCGRSPHGERGLKLDPQRDCLGLQKSLPTRGAWIEIAASLVFALDGFCRSPHGERGLKFGRLFGVNIPKRRSPHGERGLK